MNRKNFINDSSL